MQFKNILQILISYRLSLIKIFFFELLYLVKGNKRNKFIFSKNDVMTDNTPKIFNVLKPTIQVIKKVIRYIM